MRMDSAEITEWMAFERLEPFGGLHDELMLGQVAAVVANVNRNEKVRPEPFTPADFGPGLRKALGERAPVLLADPKAHSDMLLRRLFPGSAKKAGLFDE